MSERHVVLSSAEYRVVTDRFSGYEVQYRPRFWPFWRQANGNNTSHTLDEAVTYARRHARRDAYVVAVLGRVEVEVS
jgi:hypothetical protein